MKVKYSVSMLCKLLGVNRSSYYKWRNRQGLKNRYEKERELLTGLLAEEHQKHPSYGYHRLADAVFRRTGWIFSHNLAHKCCKQAEIKSKARKHRKYQKPGEESRKCKNLVRDNWHPRRPLSLVSSDMTMFKSKGKWYEWTLLIDAFNNEILAHKVSDKPGDNRPYYHVLEELNKIAGKKNEQTAPITFHTDQGAVYSSAAFFKAHEKYNIIRSMSRGGTPTDNPVIESLNGWIKEELYVDFNLDKAEDVPQLLDQYVNYYNNERAAAALNYKSPIQYKTELGFV